VAWRARGGASHPRVSARSAENASQAVNDFRKDRGNRVATPPDNVSELTARTNDDGWAERLSSGSADPSQTAGPPSSSLSTSAADNLEKNGHHRAYLRHPTLAKQVRRLPPPSSVIVGKDGGYTATQADACVMSHVHPNNVTPTLRGLSASSGICGFPPHQVNRPIGRAFRSSQKSELNFDFGLAAPHRRTAYFLAPCKSARPSSSIATARETCRSCAGQALPADTAR